MSREKNSVAATIPTTADLMRGEKGFRDSKNGGLGFLGFLGLGSDDEEALIDGNFSVNDELNLNGDDNGGRVLKEIEERGFKKDGRWG